MTLRRSCVIAATAVAVASLGETSAFSLAPSMPAAKLSLGNGRATAGRISPLRMALSTGEARTAQSKDLMKYSDSVYTTQRRKTRTVQCGDVPIGSEHPIALQTMTTAMTTDVQGSIDQVMRCADAGAQLVRLTVQGQREADAASRIKEGLLKKGYTTPLVADIHFAPKIAMQVAEAFDKIRINPGNFADGRKSFKEISYDEPGAYQAELDYIEETFTPLVLKCKELGRAMRIGTNHGSLSARTLSYYGDTPAGMVESAFEFARICQKHDYHNFLFSMKASNPKVMVAAYRLLAAEMYDLGWDYPLHLGVTEAGEGEDGRMKSAIGIGSLLQDGLGDTIRVSLTEDPWLELDPSKKLKAIADAQRDTIWTPTPTWREESRDFKTFTQRIGQLPVQKEADPVDVRNVLHRDGSVISAVTLAQLGNPDKLYYDLGCKTAVGMPFKDLATSDSIFLRTVPAASAAKERLALKRLQEVGVGVLAPAAELVANPIANAIAVFSLEHVAKKETTMPEGALRMAITVRGDESDEQLAALKGSDAVMLFIETPKGLSRIHSTRRVMNYLKMNDIDTPVIHHIAFADESKDELVLTTGSQVGCSLVDGNGDGVMVESSSITDLEFLRLTSFGLLQGSRMRNIKTEYVSCPSCGRTLFDLQLVTAEISEATGHLPGVTVAIMGCIVNGPGEMADADFGYVGGAPGKIDLYVGKEVVRKAIPSARACDELIELIKEYDRWVEKPEEAVVPV
eukprot:CAMPEP_0179464298 /NCGR_PEP_ID=MMETSP0799-20121207/46154_1 /TAXON_ID=46947 /ORGANISM="Geminigera cryophila, Strain CCMP2564" /LENGTH=739 /DNA_ID=CAMNT_0021268021 /DNA_START=24 /DNA_END=2243 /DNA_ORIENTATION=+